MHAETRPPMPRIRLASEPLCDIVIPIHNNRALTRACLEELHRNTGTPYRLILVDDASDEPTAFWLRRVAAMGAYGPALLLRNEQSLGWTGATNLGLAASSAPFICLLNNDTLPAPGWLERMLAHLGQEPRLALLQPWGNDRELRDELQADLDGNAARLAAQHGGRLIRTSYVSGYCLLMRRSLLQALGPFDTAFPQGLWADHDYCRKAQDLGFFSAVARDALVLHLQNRTLKTLKGDWRAEARQGERIFISRWGYKQGVFWRPDRRLDQATAETGRQMELLYGAADRGHVFYVALEHGETPQWTPEVHGLPPHSNVLYQAVGLPKPLRAAWLLHRLAYLRRKGRVQHCHRGDLARLDLGGLPLDSLPPEDIGVVYRGK